MTQLPINKPHDEPQQRVRCYGCYRPLDLCFCDQIPQVKNRTEILLLQHMRERFHPFNTARIVRQSLNRCKLLVDHNVDLAKRLDQETLSPNVGVLYPGGRLLKELPPQERPDQLIIIDGTWHHARTLVRDIPILSTLPRYQIIPDQPGQYRIRKEPNATALSTLEATVAALDALEPDTKGLRELVGAFNSMIETQLAHPKADYGWRRNRKRSGNPMGIPRMIIDDIQNLVIAYGESEPGIAGCKRAPKASDKRLPIYWVAQRLADIHSPHVNDASEHQFRCVVKPRVELPDQFLQHVGLDRRAWDHAVSPTEFRDLWNRFLRPTDTVVVYHNSTFGLLDNTDVHPEKRLVLKSVNFDPMRKHRTLDAYLRENEIATPSSLHPGRAGQRLANGIAMVRHLSELGAEARRTSA